MCEDLDFLTWIDATEYHSHSITGLSMGKKGLLCCLRRPPSCQASGSHIRCVELDEDVVIQHIIKNSNQFQPVRVGLFETLN